MSNQQIYPTPEEIKAKKKEFLAKTKPKNQRKLKSRAEIRSYTHFLLPSNLKSRKAFKMVLLIKKLSKLSMKPMLSR